MSHSGGRKLIISGISSLMFFSVAAQSVFAAAAVDFPSCLNPQVAAMQVNTGNEHGVVGKSTPYSGVDSIYSLQNGNVLQCLCTNDGAGIQTNWLKISGMSQNEINDLIAQGWTYIDNGALWGLQSDPYLAKNIEYACKGTSGSSNGTSASITALQQSVLGLASTGSSAAILGSFLLGISSLITGLFLARVKRNK